MKKIKLFLRNIFFAFLYPRPIVGIFYLPKFFANYLEFKKNSTQVSVDIKDFHPCLMDSVTNTPFDAHYFYQGAWLARKIRHSAQPTHVDIGSSVLTMSVLSAFVNVTFIDFRPLYLKIEGMNCIAGDILNLEFESNSIHSLSCLHVLEHIGLGRYGDPIDPSGSELGAKELARVLAIGGSLFLSVPVGRERVCFNAHRVFSPQTVVDMFRGLKLVDFSCVNDAGQFLQNQPLDVAINNEYGCGFFHFEKNHDLALR
jgi:Caenorhabditis protein of unknown function, DUF268